MTEGKEPESPAPSRPTDSNLTEQELDELADDWHRSVPPELRAARLPRLWLYLAGAALCFLFAFQQYSDARYWFSHHGEPPYDLGRAIAFEPAQAENNTFVSVTGMRNPSRGMQFDSVLGGTNVFQFMGNKRLFVESRALGDRNDGSMAERPYEGRLTRLQDTSYFRPVNEFSQKNYAIDIPEDAWIVLCTQTPDVMLYSPLAFVLSLLAGVYCLFRAALSRRTRRTS